MKKKKNLKETTSSCTIDVQWKYFLGKFFFELAWENFPLREKFTALHYTALKFTALHFTSLHCTALHCTALPCTLQKSVKKRDFIVLHRSRESVLPVCKIFKQKLMKKSIKKTHNSLTYFFSPSLGSRNYFILPRPPPM